MKTVQLDKKQADKIAKAIKVLAVKNPAISELDNVVLKGGYLVFTDLKIWIKIKNFELGEDFSLSHKEFTDTVLSLSEFTTELESEKVVFKSGKKTYKFANGGDVDALLHPQIKRVSVADKLTISDLSLIKTALAFVSKDPIYERFHNVYLRDGEVAATDQHRLFWKKSDFNYGRDLFLTPNTIKLLQIFNSEGFVVTEGDGQIQLENSEIIITQYNPSIQFPDFHNIIPIDNPISVTLNTKEVSEALLEAVKFSNPSTKMVVLNINGKFEVSASDVALTREFSSELSSYTKTKGDDIKIGFNGNLFNEVLKSVDGEHFTMFLSTPNKPAVINDSIILMPVIILEDKYSY